MLGPAATGLEDPDDATLASLSNRQQRPRDRDAWVNDPTRLYAATEWDKFHREDLALSRAVGACALAEELFAVCAMMDHWFHLGEGKLILRSAGIATGTACSVVGCRAFLGK